MANETPGWLDGVIDGALARATRRVAVLRAQHPGDDSRTLGERLVKSSANRAGWLGAATGAVAVFALPIGLPAGVAVTLALEAELIFSLLEVYGLDARGEKGRLRLAALWAGAGFADAAKSAGLKLGTEALARAMAGSLPARIIARLNPVLLRAILKRLGMGWMPRLLKLWPLLGAPVAYAMDRAALRTLGAGVLATLDSVVREPAPAPNEPAPAPNEPAPAPNERAPAPKKKAPKRKPALKTKGRAAAAATPARRASRKTATGAGRRSD